MPHRVSHRGSVHFTVCHFLLHGVQSEGKVRVCVVSDAGCIRILWLLGERTRTFRSVWAEAERVTVSESISDGAKQQCV